MFPASGLLAWGDGTLRFINSWFVDQTEIHLLQEETKLLELEEKKTNLEVKILEHAIKNKVYQAQLDYMGSKGF